jgi:hypothetical protein
MNKEEKRAERIWKAIFDDLYDRGQFDWWWDGIEDETKKEIKEKIIGIIVKELLRGS